MIVDHALLVPARVVADLAPRLASIERNGLAPETIRVLQEIDSLASSLRLVRLGAAPLRSVTEEAERLGVSTRTVRRRIRSGRITAHRVGSAVLVAPLAPYA